jgi:hypothetical protein
VGPRARCDFSAVSATDLSGIQHGLNEGVATQAQAQAGELFLCRRRRECPDKKTAAAGAGENAGRPALHTTRAQSIEPAAKT